jgi:pyridoxine 5-phosphate synthase
LTLQIAPTDDLMERALEVKPWMMTLMPFKGDDLSVSKGIDFGANADLYTETAATLKGNGINVCFFVDPDIDAVKNAARAKADAVELNTFLYAAADNVDSAEVELEKLEQMANLAAKLNLSVNCGNGLSYKNIRHLIELGVFEEFTVGYAITGRAMMVGLERAVTELVETVRTYSEK